MYDGSLQNRVKVPAQAYTFHAFLSDLIIQSFPRFTSSTPGDFIIGFILMIGLAKSGKSSYRNLYTHPHLLGVVSRGAQDSTFIRVDNMQRQSAHQMRLGRETAPPV